MPLRMEEIHTASLLYPVQNRLNERGRQETGRRIQNIREPPFQGLRVAWDGGGAFPTPSRCSVLNTALDLWSGLCSAHNLEAPPAVLPKHPQVLALPSVLSISSTPEALNSTGRPGIAGWHDLPLPGGRDALWAQGLTQVEHNLACSWSFVSQPEPKSNPYQSPQSHEDQPPPHLPPCQFLFLPWTQMFVKGLPWPQPCVGP